MHEIMTMKRMRLQFNIKKSKYSQGLQFNINLLKICVADRQLDYLGMLR
jgi:hypothetical protein